MANAPTAENTGPNSSSSSHGQTLVIAGVVIALLFVVNKISTSKARDPREPILISPRIPVVGHILGLLKHQTEYWISLSNNVHLPICEVNILGGRVYLVTSPELFQSVYRHSKVFSFDPLTAVAIKKIFQMPDRLIKLLQTKLPGLEDAQFPLHTATNRAMNTTLTPGASSPILLMNARALGRLAQFLHDIDDESIVVGMNRWLGDIFTVATSVGVYGPQSPLEKDFSLVQHTENFADQLGMLMIGVAPSLIASKGHAGRQAYTTAFKEYYDNGGDKDASALVQARKEVLGGGGFTTDDLASLEISVMIAATANSNPTLFWFLSYIYSNPGYLAMLREEVALAIAVEGSRVIFDVQYLLKDCPLLVASWQEVLRTKATTISSRIITEDTLLNDQYLLRKGGVVQLVSTPNHTSNEIWGEDANQFNPARFLKSSQDHLDRDVRKNRRDGYTPFGGGSSLCPGRNFVTMEILGAVATFVTGYDITKPDGSLLEMTKHKEIPFGAQIRHAEKDPQIRVTRRKEWVGKTWHYEVGDGVGEGSAGLAFNAVVNHVH